MAFPTRLNLRRAHQITLGGILEPMRLHLNIFVGVLEPRCVPLNTLDEVLDLRLVRQKIPGGERNQRHVLHKTLRDDWNRGHGLLKKTPVEARTRGVFSRTPLVESAGSDHWRCPMAGIH